jgi:hypothetical protein
MALHARQLPGEGRAGAQHNWNIGAAMKWLKTLNNPFLLGAQGFLAGAVLFFATHPDAAEQRLASAAEQTKAESPRTGA